MAFINLLTHRCTLLLPNGETGETDLWGRPILLPQRVIKNIPCRFSIKTIRKSEPTGVSWVKELTLLLSYDQTVSPEMLVIDIRNGVGEMIQARPLHVVSIFINNISFGGLNYRVLLEGAS